MEVYTEDKGQESSGATMKKRVVSLVDIGCDILRALGCIHMLVGHAHPRCECIEELGKGLEVCTESITGEMENASLQQIASKAMDALVWEFEFSGSGTASSMVEWALSPHRVSPAKLVELQPDIVLTQLPHTPVISIKRVHAALETLLRKSVHLISIKHPSRLEDLWLFIEHIAKEVGVNMAKSKEILESLKSQCSVVQSMCAGRVPRRILCLHWDGNNVGVLHHMTFIVGGWISNIVEIVHGIDISRHDKINSGTINVDTVVSLSPDIVIIANQQWGLQQMHDHVLGNSCFQYLFSDSCFIQTVVVDGPNFLARFAPFVILKSLEALCEILHPECQPFGHEDSLWCNVEGKRKSSNCKRENAITKDHALGC